MGGESVLRIMPSTAQQAPSGQVATYETQNVSQNSGSHVLRLRAVDSAPPNVNEEAEPSRHIRWSEEVVDNEGKGKKSSKG